MTNNSNLMIQAQNSAPVGFMTGPSAAMVAAAESAKAQIQCAYMMALQCPRSYFAAEQAVVKACSNPLFAEKVEYKLPRAGTTISGPTIRLAELIRREWRNIFTTERVMHDDDRQMIVQVTAMDLETNSIETAEVIVPKTVERKYVKEGQEILSERENSLGKPVYTVRATDSEVDMTRKAMISKALRNAIFRLVPAELVQIALATARQTIASADAKDPKEATRRLILCFEEQGVGIDKIEKHIGHTLEKATAADVKNLRGLYKQMLNGASWDDLVNPEPQNAAIDELNAKVEQDASK